MADINIVKKVCQELGMTQKELAEMLDVPQSTLSTWASGDIPKMADLALKLLLENAELKAKLLTIKEAHQVIDEL